MMPKLIAILGESGSGKSALGMEIALALRDDGIKTAIFSLDSLSVYKYIDIASAKASKTDRQSVKHYGVDVLHPTQKCDAMLIKSLLEDAFSSCLADKTDILLIVGGSSFYLKSIIDGLSQMPKTSQNVHDKIESIGDLKAKYSFLQSVDLDIAQNIKANDTYRINKNLEIYFSSNMSPTQYFAKYPKIRFAHKIHLYSLQIDKDILSANISTRTQNMIELGLIEEVKNLLALAKDSQCLKAIGIKETIEYLNSSEKNIHSLKELISTHTRQLAKRQRTFNKTQFSDIIHLAKEPLKDAILKLAKESI